MAASCVRETFSSNELDEALSLVSPDGRRSTTDELKAWPSDLGNPTWFEAPSERHEVDMSVSLAAMRFAVTRAPDSSCSEGTRTRRASGRVAGRPGEPVLRNCRAVGPRGRPKVAHLPTRRMRTAVSSTT